MRISPSKLSTFLQCGQKYKYKYVDLLQEESGQAALNGIFVHRVLEELYKGEDRSFGAALALVQALEPEANGADIERCALLVRNLFDLEFPAQAPVLRAELDIELPYGEHVLKGIIDRVDSDGYGYIIIDYKTGKAPSDKDLDEKALGIKIYALLGRLAFGKPPTRVKLYYLGDPKILTFEVSEAMVDSVERKVNKGLESIVQAEATSEFKAKPSWKCKWCSFKNICPAVDKKHQDG